jgi:hypothetical protein
MKLKLLKFLTVSLLTLIVLFPEVLVCNVIWEKHLQLIEMQREISEVTISISSHQNTGILKAFHLGKWLFLLFPICLGIFIFL